MGIKSFMAMKALLLVTAMAWCSAGVAVAGGDRAQTCPPRCKSASQALDEKGYVTIADIPQWITINGKRCDNQVILFVHDGPGNLMSPYSDALHKTWENEFTIVQWDQRGAGKTYAANLPSGEVILELFNGPDLSVDQITQDGLEVTRYLKTRLQSVLLWPQAFMTD